MVMKSYTDLEQSKRLAEILPPESADICYRKERFTDKYMPESICYKYARELYADHIKIIPGWSLAALLEALPKDKYKDIDLCHGGYKSNGYISEWFCSYEQQEPFILKIFNAPNAIDACYELVLKLHELNLL